MNFIIVGCGRVGAELAHRLYKEGHQVVIVDHNPQAFTRLDPAFRGRTVEGEALTRKVLERADIEHADGLAAVTNSDTLNAVVGHIAKAIYHVSNVVVRNYDPGLRPMLEAFGLQTVGSSSWGAQRVLELLANPDYRTVFSAGNGEVEVYEMRIPATWDGRRLGELFQACQECVPVALTRSGRAMLPDMDLQLQKSDILNVSATFEGIRALHARLFSAEER